MRFVLIALLACVALTLGAVPLEPGLWMQTSSTAGDCADCLIEVEAPSPHLRTLHASNGWVGYLRYHPDQDRYTGFLELTETGDAMIEDWHDEVFVAEGVVDGPTFTLEADSGMHEFRATYRR